MSAPKDMADVRVTDTFGDDIVVSVTCGHVYVRIIVEGQPDRTVEQVGQLAVELDRDMAAEVCMAMAQAVVAVGSES